MKKKEPEKLKVYVNLERLTKAQGRFYDPLFAEDWKKEAIKTDIKIAGLANRGIYKSEAEKAQELDYYESYSKPK